MMMRTRFFLVLIVLSIQTSFSQNKTMSLKDVLRDCIKNNFEINKSDIDILIAKSKTKETKSNLFPQINIKGQFADNTKLQTSYLPGELAGAPGTDIAVQFGKEYNTNAHIEVSQMIYNAEFWSGLKINKLNEQVKEIINVKTQEEVIFKISKLYYELLIAQQNKQTLDANYKKLENLYKTTKDLFDNQLAKRLDVNRIKVNLINLKTKKKQLIGTISTNINIIKLIAGLPIESKINFEDKSLLNCTNKSYTTDINSSIEKRQDYQLVSKKIELNKQQIKNVNSGYLPSLYAFAQNGWNNQNNEFKFTGDNVKWNQSQVIGLKLQIPVFDGLKKKNKATQFKLELEKTNKELDYIKNTIKSEVINAQTNIEISLTNINSQKENVGLAEEVYNDVNLQYKEGLTDINDVLSAETELREAKVLYLQEILKHKINELNLLKAKGELITLINK